jgi:alkylation response protein AidB-like acyl-CoA dehydrogenase
LTISQVGDLEIRLHAAEALLQRAARFLDEAEEVPAEATVAKVSTAVAEAKVLTTGIAILATNKLFELAGTQSTLGNIISTGIGGTLGPTRCMIRCGGNTMRSAIIISTTSIHLAIR